MDTKLSRFGVETRFKRFGEETKPPMDETYPDVPNPRTVDCRF